MFLGIDGGGTKTKFTLEYDGQYFSTVRNTIHLKQISDQEFYDTLKSGIEEVLLMANQSVEDLSYTFVAIPGYGQFPETEKVIHDTLTDILGKDKYDIGNDCVNGWSGSLNAKEGINIVLGTGAISYGVDKNGQGKRSSGWGYFLGDEASGYYIGHRLLTFFTKMSDGRMKKTGIYDKIKERFNIKDDFEIINIAQNLKREEIADVSKILPEALKEDDCYAKELLDEIAKEAALSIDCLIDSMDFNKPVKVSYSGGVFNMKDVLVDKIKEHLKNEVEIVKPFTTPDKGSIIMAKYLYDNE